MSKKIKIVDIQTPGSEKPTEPIRWNECVICQEKTSEDLQCPADTKRTDLGTGYQSFETIIQRCITLNWFPSTLNHLDQFNEGQGIAQTFQIHKAKWHKSCRLKFSDLKISRQEKRKRVSEVEDDTQSENESKLTRLSCGDSTRTMTAGCENVISIDKAVSCIKTAKKTVGSRTGLPSVDMRTGSLKVLFTVDVYDYKSGGNWGSGIFLGDVIVLTDHPNSKLMAYNNEGEVLSYLQLPSKPYDVTKVTENTVAVSCRESQQIHVINVKDMKLQNTITVNAPVVGLVYVENEYIVADNDTLTWVDASSGETNEDGKTSGHSFYIHACGRKEYVCANGSTTVSYTSNGHTKFAYTNQNLSGPRGIDSDYQGNIYICGIFSNDIHQITPEGKLIRIISSLTVGLRYPWVIRFETNSNRFLLTSWTSGKVLICEIS